jgi:heat shock protein HtpX
VKRRFSTRDLGLTTRMGATLLLVVALYAAIAVGFVAVIWISLKWGTVAVLIGCVVVVTALGHITGASGLLLRAAGAQPFSDSRFLRESVTRLAALADIPAPELSLVESSTPNAFTVGTRRRRSTIAVTSSLLELLEPEEVEAVLAHELSHIANRDASVMTFASVPRTLGETLIGEQSSMFFLWFFVWWVGLPLWAVGSLLTLTLSRYREYTADRGAALLTGRPETLMSALERLERGSRGIPATDLRAIGRVDALCIVSSGGARVALFRDHPPLEKRLARLAAIAREQGRTVGP